jgi:hypothetical protein
MDAINLCKQLEKYHPFFVEDPFAPESEIGREVDHRGGLPNAALLVGTGDRLAHQAPGRRVLTDVNSSIGRPLSLSMTGGSARTADRASPGFTGGHSALIGDVARET